MNLPDFSVKRPIFTTMVTLIVVILGAVSLSRLQIDMLPNIELPTLTIRTNYEGASPEVMERLVTQIIEEIVATVPGVEEISSTSSEGRSTVRVSFVWGTNIDTAAIDVQGKLEDEINELPEDIIGPRTRKFDIASFPVVLLGISSNLDPVELTELIEVQAKRATHERDVLAKLVDQVPCPSRRAAGRSRGSAPRIREPSFVFNDILARSARTGKPWRVWRPLETASDASR